MYSRFTGLEYWGFQQHQRELKLSEDTTTGGHSRQRRKDRGRVYLRKPAASEEAEQSESLSRDSYTHLRRRDKWAGKTADMRFGRKRGSGQTKRTTSDRSSHVVDTIGCKTRIQQKQTTFRMFREQTSLEGST